jgi:hypothetical protein
MPDVTLPDGTLVRASPLAARERLDAWRDYGLYLDPAWEPDWPADLIDWPDFGLPAVPEMARTRIVAAFRRARAGEHVEVGCLGGRGRTGTVLACFAVLCGLSPVEAIAFVRNGYDPAAIETQAQERWVSWFAAGIAEGERAE